MQTTALGNGFVVKAGRFFSGIGYLNPQHAHTWDFVDNPLAYQAMLGTQYGDDGVQLTLARADRPVRRVRRRARPRPRLSGQRHQPQRRRHALRCSRTPAATSARATAGAPALSVLDARGRRPDAASRSTPPAGRVANAFSGSTPRLGRRRRLEMGAERQRHAHQLQAAGRVPAQQRAAATWSTTVGGADSAGSFRAAQSGWYLQGVYQFMPRLALGLRTERLDAGHARLRRRTPAALAGNGCRPHKNSLMLDFSPSEFSRVRLQLARDRSRAGPHRQPAVPAVPDEPGRARRAPLLSAVTRRPDDTNHEARSTAALVLLAAPLRAARRCRRRRRCACSPASPSGARWRRNSAAALVEVSVATTALQDPHRIEARPSLIARARNADLVVCTGAELEVGWLPLLLQQSGNAEGAARASRATSRRPTSCASSTCRRRLDRVAGRRACGRQSAHPDRSAQHRAGRRGAGGAAAAGRPRATPATTRSGRPISRSAGSRRSRAGQRRRRR